MVVMLVLLKQDLTVYTRLSSNSRRSLFLSLLSTRKCKLFPGDIKTLLFARVVVYVCHANTLEVETGRLPV